MRVKPLSKTIHAHKRTPNCTDNSESYPESCARGWRKWLRVQNGRGRHPCVKTLMILAASLTLRQCRQSSCVKEMGTLQRQACSSSPHQSTWTHSTQPSPSPNLQTGPQRRAGWPAHSAPPPAPGSPGPATLPGLGFPFALITPKPLSSKWLHTHTHPNTPLPSGHLRPLTGRA